MNQKQHVTKIMAISDIIEKFPASIVIMQKYGLNYENGNISQSETIEQSARGHGIDEEQIEEMIEEINDKLSEEENEDYTDFEESLGEEE